MSHHPDPSRRQLLRGAIALGALAPGSLAPAQTAATGESFPETVLYYGTTAPLPRQIALTAGPLSLTFEPELAFIRHIRFGEREVLRGIYAAVRDRSWLTVAPRVTNVVTRTSGDWFDLTFDVDCKQDDIDYFWNGRITGSSAGSVRFEFDGVARSSFMRNRIGFCVLHPIAECAGQPCAIESADGSKQQGRFPDLISPNQPFVNMRAISHEVAPGVTANVRFEGDIFEMEDQRNWTDASYKTYCTPLGLPYPAKVEKGARVRQAVALTLAVQGNARRARTESRPEITLETGARGAKLPKIGIGWGPDQPPLARTESLRLRAAGLSHLRVDLDLANPDFTQRLEQASAAGLPLEIAVFVTNQAERELTALAGACGRVKPRIARWLVFHKDEITTSPERVRLARKTLGALSHTPFGTGTNQYFTELNRNRPSIDAMDAVCYSANPQVHAFDNLSLVEALAGQAYTVTSARSFCGSRPIAVTPITLRPRFNPQAAAPEAPRSGALPSRIDPRQMSLFAAAWTLGSIKYLAESGADSATYYETTGWGGIMERAAGSPLPSLFRAFPGGVFPLYHVLADIGEFGSGAEARVIHSSDPLAVDGCLLRSGTRARLLLANFSPRVQYVRVVKPDLGRAVRVRRLNERTAIHAMKSPEEFRKDPGSLVTFPGADFEMALLPFEVARVDAA